LLILTSSLHNVLDDALVGGGTFPTHFFGQKNPFFFDHFRRRSENNNIFQKTMRIGLEPSNLILET